MQRVTRGVLAVAGVVGLGMFGSAGPGALAAPAPTTPAVAGGQSAAAGKPVCTVSDSVRPNRMIELSGLAATPTGYVTVNDSSDSDNRRRVFFLDKACTYVREVRYASPPGDPEDLAVGKDGTVWVADTGDNDTTRSTIALWKVPPNSNTATLFRMRYPEGKFNAEALLLDANDQPIIVTKGPGVCGIYMLNGPLGANSTQVVSLRKVGEFKPQRTGTSNTLGFIGQTQVTGGANSPDRKKVVLRTYSDAYEWDVPDGDVVKAITTGKPRITPLPDEPQGEAITYSPDGATFLTVSETELALDGAPAQILQYTPATEAKPALTAAPGAERNTLSWYQRLDLTEATSLVAGVGVLGVLLVVAGVVGILYARRSRASTARGRRGGDATGVDSGAGEGGPTVALATQNLATHSSGGHVYYAGGAAYRPEADGSDERWRRPGHAGTEYGGTEYGGTEYGGTEYGGTEYGGGQPAAELGTPPGYGPGDPQGYGPPAGYPPPAGR